LVFLPTPARISLPKPENKLRTLGYYVFGRDMRAGVGKNTKVGKWNSDNYRKMWLNLVYAVANYKQETLEMRLFAGTTSFEKVYYQALLTMAFTHICNTDFKREIITEGVTLSDIVSKAIKDKTVSSNLIKFIETRKNKFQNK
jgi:hypothetical protein